MTVKDLLESFIEKWNEQIQDRANALELVEELNEPELVVRITPIINMQLTYTGSMLLEQAVDQLYLHVLRQLLFYGFQRGFQVRDQVAQELLNSKHPLLGD